MYVCMYACMSVMGLQLKYTGLHIVYIPLWHVPLKMPSCDGGMAIEDEDLEDRRRRQNESRCMEEG